VILVDAVHAGALLLELRETGRTVPELPDGLRPASLDEAYAIQDELHRQGGWPVGVLKVGCTSELAQKALAIDSPIAGIVPKHRVLSSGTRFAGDQFHHHPLLESEFALRVGTDIAADADPASIVGRDLVDAVAPAIELVGTRFDAPMGGSGFSKIADNSAAAAVVLGSPASSLPDDLAAIGVTLRCGGEVLAQGNGAAVLGDPYRSFAWSLRHELSRGRSVPAGTWVITGTCTGLVPCPPGAAVTAAFDGLGEVEVTVDQ
jgi:2-keto-4-pentenoate hydratase